MPRDSIVLINTGAGKGKSSAAFGVMSRSWARGWTVGVVQFIKSEKWKVGERKLAEHLGIEWFTLGDGFTWDSKDMDRTEAAAREAWRAAKEKIASGRYRLVVLDELSYPINWGWIAVSEVVGVITTRPPSANLIITGRDAPQELIDCADTATEMRSIKHAFDRGVRVIRGMDF